MQRWQSAFQRKCPGLAWRWQSTFTTNPSIAKARRCGTIPVEARPVGARRTSGALPVCMSSGASVRLTLALTYVLPKESVLSIVKRLLKRRKALGFRASVLYLDKGFCSTEVIQYLQEIHESSVLARAVRGKAGGTRALCRGRKAYRTTHTFSDGTTSDLAVVPTLKRDKKTGKQRRTWLVFVIIHLDWSAKKVQQRYRHRFGIESSYRQLGELRAHTNSRNVALRFFFLALALLLVNIWTYLRCHCTRLIGYGPFRLDVKLFRLPRFIAFLRRAIERAFGTIESIPIYAA